MASEALNTDALSGTVLMAASPAANGAPRDPLLGTVLSSAYRIERVIGEGAMGLLYEATHLRLDRRFAVKVLHQPLAARDDMRARFDREARVMSRIKSDHVVDVVDVTTAPDGRTCIVTELLEGCDLEQHLEDRGGKLPTAEAVALMRECLRGLSAAHALGVVHRDLKPSNLFLAREASGRATLKVLDFGVAKSGGEAELTAAGMIMGTPAYMAPEQARSATYVDARSDVYAAGAVLYRLLTGTPPYAESDVNSTLIRLMSEAPARPRTLERSIPHGLEAVIERAMARDPAHRHASASALDAELAAFDEHATNLGGELASGSGGASAPSAESRTLSRKARLVRPLAVLTCTVLAVWGGSGITALLALLADGLSKQPQISSTELLLALIAGGAVALGLVLLGIKALSAAWRNAPDVQALTGRAARAMLGSATTLGALSLGTTLYGTLTRKLPSATLPLESCVHLGLALLVGGVLLTPKRAPR